MHDIACDNKKLNYALLCFELMWVALSYKTKDDKNDLITVLHMKANRPYSQFSDRIGAKIFNLIKKNKTIITQNQYGEGTISINGKSCLELSDRLFDKIFWIYAAANYEINNSTCDEFYYRGVNSLSEEVNVARKFKKLSEIIK